MTSIERTNIETTRQYLAALARGVTGDALAAFFTQDVVQEEFPNRLAPHGARRDLRSLLEGAVRGQQVTATQHFDLLHAIAEGDHVACEVQWTGTLAVPVGTLATGSEMRARFAIFLDFRDGKIAAQRNYDCFEPW